MTRTEYKKQWRADNREHVNAYFRAYNKRNPDQRKAQKLAVRYGLPLDVFRLVLSLQEGRCCICGTVLTEPVVDHNHTRKYVRGLLCHRCNLGIGYFLDSPVLLFQAAVYLGMRDGLGKNTETVDAVGRGGIA